MKAGAALLTAALVMAPAPAAHAAPPAGLCTGADPAHPPVTAEPWAQRTLDPAAAWPRSTGKGVVVAVVDSGVDADHPQLAGAVLRGQDFYLVGDLPGNFDCASHGTAVASIIAARPARGIGFAGVAPGATILPARVSEREVTDDGGVAAVDPIVLARAIWYAADHGAGVINLSLAGSAQNRYVRDAVAHARARDALVVAAAGNQQQGRAPQPSYPAGYDGVLGVGAVDRTGARVAGSQIGPQVDLVAPGGGVLAATRAGGHQYWDGTSFATAFVSGTAALVRSAWPALTADEVAARILATATPAPGGRDSAAYGAGLVNPYRAVTDGLINAPPAILPPLPVAAVQPRPARSTAWTAMVAAVAVTALVLLAAFVVGRGRRTGWQAQR
jgi:type VII secretion-associated serine protease mycosin